MEKQNTTLRLSSLSNDEITKLQDEAMEAETLIWDPPVSMSDILKFSDQTD